MKINARIVRMIGGEKVKAYASVCIEDSFMVYGIKVIEGEKGKFVAMPTRKNKRGEYYDVCYPVTKEMRNDIFEAVLKEYKKKVEEM